MMVIMVVDVVTAVQDTAVVLTEETIAIVTAIVAAVIQAVITGATTVVKKKRLAVNS